MTEISLIESFVLGMCVMFVLIGAFWIMKVYVDDEIAKAKREVKQEIRRQNR